MKRNIYSVLAVLLGLAWLSLVPLAGSMGQEESRHGLGLAVACMVFAGLWFRAGKPGEAGKP